MDTNFTGVIPDPRPQNKKDQDFQHKELAGAVSVNWTIKDPSIWKKYSIRNQNGSGSCVSQGSAKAIETKTGIVQSAHPIYRSRLNYPSEGMWLQDAGRIVTTIGTASEQADPSQNMTEAQMDLPITIPSSVKAGIYVMVPVDIDQYAEALEIAGGVPIIVHANINEWTNVPVYNGSTNINLSHCICITDYFLYNGKKSVLIDDSWGLATSIGNGGQRVLSEDYLKARCVDGMYFLNLAPTDNKPKHKFTKYLTYGMVGDSDVKALQQILAYEGLFPVNLETGNYLNITASAILKWQINHAVAPLTELNPLMGKSCGPKTIAKLNALYS